MKSLKHKLIKNILFIVLITFFVALKVFGFEISFKKSFASPQSGLTTKSQVDFSKIKNNKSYEKLIYDKELVLDAFKKMAFGSEFKFEDRKRDKVAKWKIPIVFSIETNEILKNKYRTLIEAHAKELAEITRHPISVWQEGTPPNGNALIILTHDFDYAIYKKYNRAIKKLLKGQPFDFFKNYEKMRNQMPRLWAFGNFLSKPHSKELIYALIFVNIRVKFRSVESVIIEEMTQILGVPNDPEELDYTLFNDRGNNETLTEVDKMVLKILYHEKIKEGMTVKDVESVFDEVYEDIMKRG